MTHLNVGHKRQYDKLHFPVLNAHQLFVVKTCWERSTNKVILKALNFSYLRQIDNVSLQYKLAEEYTCITVLSGLFLKRSRKTLLFSFTTKEAIKVHFGFVTC